MRTLIAILLLVETAQAQNVVFFDSRIAPWTNNFNGMTINLAVKDRAGNPDLYDWTNANLTVPSVVQALANPRSNLWVPITGTVAQARKDLRQTIQDSREAVPAHKFYRQAWRKVQRDIAQAIGLPATNGLAWGVEETYSALATVTNATTRRDYHLRTLEADLNQTRHQLERQFSQIDFWWTPEDPQ